MELKEAIPGFEPGSPDSKSGVINHYTKSPGSSAAAVLFADVCVYQEQSVHNWLIQTAYIYLPDSLLIWSFLCALSEYVDH